MAKIIKRTWTSGSRNVKRVAYGYTFQDKDGKQVRVSDASWDREAAEKALAARLLNIAPEPSTQRDGLITFKASGT